MSYTPINWKDYPDKTTPVSAENLNHMDQGILNNDTEIGRIKESINEQKEGMEEIALKVEDLEEEIKNASSDIILDFSKASSDVQDLKTFLQKALEKLFPAHVSIPILSATTDKIIYSGFLNENTSPHKAFDGDDNTAWAGNALTYQYIGYDFENPVAIIRATFVQRYTSAYGMNGYKIQASNDKETWIDMTEQTNGPSDKEEHTITFNEKLEQYRYWRLYINASKSATNVYPGIASLNFYNYI